MALFKRDQGAQPSKESAEASEVNSSLRRTPVSSPKRRHGALALALALAVIGGLLMWWFQQTSGAQQYVKVNTALERGDRVERSQLAAIEVIGEPVELIPVDQVEEIIGQVVTSDVASGTPLTSAAIAPDLGVQEGQSIVGVAVGAGRLPSRALSAGDQVQVVFSPSTEAAGQAAGQHSSSSRAPISATVEGTGRDDAGNRTIVDLSVPAEDSATVAQWGAQDSVSLVLGAAEPTASETEEPKEGKSGEEDAEKKSESAESSKEEDR